MDQADTKANTIQTTGGDGQRRKGPDRNPNKSGLSQTPQEGENAKDPGFLTAKDLEEVDRDMGKDLAFRYEPTITKKETYFD